MKNKIMLLLITLVGIIVFTPDVNAAANATISSITNLGSTGISYSPEGKGDWATYTSYQEQIRMGNANYQAYCVDPALSASTGDKYNCTPYNDPGLQYLFEHLTGDTVTDTLAFRFFAIYKDVGLNVTNANGDIVSRYTVNFQKAALIRYLKAIDKHLDPSPYLKGNMTAITTAQQLANTARNLSGTAPLISPTGDTSGLTYTMSSYNNTSVTYTVTSSFPISPTDVKFTCTNCQRVDTSNWTEYSVTLTVHQLSNKDCKFTIIASLGNKSGTYGCVSATAAGGKQFLVVNVTNNADNNSQNGTVSFEYEGENPKCGDPDCCTEPIPPAPEGVIANCCVTSTHSHIEEPDLDELFCRDESLKVQYYMEKCGVSQYKNQGMSINNYCDLYCTERVTIDVPPPITAKSGRYFTLTKNIGHETTSPYIQGYKRCRVRIKYNKWEEKYIKLIKQEVDLYNDYQKAAADYHFYVKGGKGGCIKDEATAEVIEVTIEPKKYCKKKSTCKVDCDPATDSACDKKTKKKSVECYVAGTTVTGKSYVDKYKKYEFKTELKYGKSKYTLDGHNYIQVGNNGTGTRTHSQYTVYDRTKVENDAKNAANALSCPAGEETNYITYGNIPDAGITNENFTATKNSLQTTMNNKADDYYRKVDDVKKLEKKLTNCVNFFNTKDKDEMYNFKAEMKFKYSQIYRDNDGSSAFSEIEIPFEDSPGCDIVGPETGSLTYEDGRDTSLPRYSEEYGEGIFNGKDFAGREIALEYDNVGSMDRFKDSNPYEAKKMFTHDARYHAICEWEEKDNNVNTLVPTGEVSIQQTANFTRHKKEYKVFLATYNGTYETTWTLKKIGENGKFDAFIQQHGGTSCAGDSLTPENMFTCTLHVEYEIVYTGKCNEITRNPDDCEPRNNVDSLFQFRVVDPSNIFPTGTTTDSGIAIAKNWTETAEGQATKEEIEQKGKNDTTYSPDNESYKFHLSPDTMRHIKNYNLSRNTNNIGGYSDFNLTCECPSEEQTNTANDPNAKGCVKCRSTLLSDLANNRITYEGQTYTVRAWASRKTINQVRDEAHWRLNR